MYERRNYLKKAFYHVMKMEMKKNKALKYEGYQRDNYELAEMFSRGEGFETSIIYVESGELFVTKDFFRLSGKEQRALIDYMVQFCQVD